MLNAIIQFSIRHKLIIALAWLALIGTGIYETTRLPIDAVPDITDNQVQVITVAPSFGATDIERLVTFPIEQANASLPGMKEIRSFSRFGLSLVTLVFNDATDIYWARQQVSERLQKVQSQIPAGIGNPELGPITTGLGEIYQYVVRPAPGYESRYSAMDLRTIQDWIVRRQLLGVKGVADVSSFGGNLKQYQIAVHPGRLAEHQLSISDVFTALENNNQNTGGAYIEKGASVLFIRTEGLIGSLDDIRNITVKHLPGGIPIEIKDVADVSIGSATRFGAMCYNDQGEVAGAVVMMLKGANSSDVIKNVKKRIQEIRKTLPKGILIEPFLDRTKMVNNAIGTVEKNLLEGALIVIAVLVIFLGNLRAGLLVASVIPLSMLFAVILMNLFGVSGNLMSLGALDFGLIVDGAVIIVEAVMHQLSHSKHFRHISLLSKPEMNKQVGLSAGKMMNSAVFGQIIILIVYLPIFSLQGIEGKMFKPMAQTVAFALLGAFLLSLTYIPMMSSWILSRKIKHKPGLSDKLLFWLERKYQHALSKTLRYPKTLISLVVVLFAFSIVVLSRLGGEFIPALEEGDFAVDTKVLTGSNLHTTIASTQKAAHLLLQRFPEVEKVVTKIGSGEIPTDPMPMEASDMMVILKDKREWTSAKSFNDLSEKMSEALKEIPGITTGFQFPVQMRFNELMTGARQDVVCKIFGENLDSLSKYARQLGKLITGVKGADNLFIEPVTGAPQVIINYNRPALVQYRLTVAAINQVVHTAFAGQSAGMVFEDEKRFDLVVRLNTASRRDIEDIRNLLVPSPAGMQVPLYLLADVRIVNGPNQIQRVDAKRRIVVGFNVRNRDVESLVGELKEKVDLHLKLPPGYYVRFGGAFENLKAAKQRLGIAVPVSLVLILVLLYMAFGSLKQGLLIYSAIPLSAIGGILLLSIRGMPFSISAGIGFIALFGVAVLNGIVLISEFNHLRKQGIHNLRRVVLMGTKMRLRPVLMTALVASLGFLPMAVSSGAGAEVQRPLATVVIGGLMIATLLTLFVLPALYILAESINQKKKKSMRISMIILLLLAVGSISAQQPVCLKEAIDSALKNNGAVRNEALITEWKRSLIGTAGNIPKTAILAEAGQINSSYTDSRVGLMQGFAMPSVYRKERALLTAEWKTAIEQTRLKKADIRKAVIATYYSIQYWQQKQAILEQADSLFARQLQLARLRVQQGQSTILEQVQAETQLSNIRLQVITTEEEIYRNRLQLQWLMNSFSLPLIQKEPALFHWQLPGDSNFLNNHPEAAVLYHAYETSIASTRAEAGRLLPEWSIAYYNMSMKGTGADNQLYTAAHRFQSVQLGINIPLFAKAGKQRVQASKLNEKVVQQAYENQLSTLSVKYRQLLGQYLAQQKIYQYYEQDGVRHANEIMQTATLQLEKGEINYTEWLLMIQQALQLKSNGTENLRTLNETIIELDYFTNQTI